MRLVCLFFISFFSYQVMAQGVLIDTMPGVPDASALLELKSNKQGFLVPRMTALERTNIPFPSRGLLVYDLDLGSLFFFDGDWIEFASSRRGLRDRDFDTSIQVEKATDEDTIRVQVKNNEVARFTDKSFYLNDGKESVYIGDKTGSNISSFTDRNTFVGHEAGSNPLTAPSDLNTLLGYRAGYSIDADANTIIGAFAGDSIKGQGNTIIGAFAGSNLVDDDFFETLNNIFIGINSGKITDGSSNIMIGQN
ncbi:MAG: hypothetical protein AAGK97_12445, partial [Bacteroidota bacterium]